MVPEKKEEKMLSLPAEEPRLLNRQKNRSKWIGNRTLGLSHFELDQDSQDYLCPAHKFVPGSNKNC